MVVLVVVIVVVVLLAEVVVLLGFRILGIMEAYSCFPLRALPKL